MDTVFENRSEAGHFLARKLMHYAHRPDVIVFGLPRGGVPVAFEVARALYAPLDVMIVRKLGVPGQEELAMGALASGGVRIVNGSIVRNLDISRKQVDAVIEREEAELRHREQLYRGGRPAPDVRGRIAILVDDGLATGASMWAAVIATRALKPAQIVVAVPVGAETTCSFLSHEVDEIVCGMTPEPFGSVGAWYKDFPQVSDSEVHDLLNAVPELP